MKITHEEIRHVSRVARIHIPDGHMDGLFADLDRMFTMVDALTQADVSDVTIPLPEHCNALHDDVPTPSLTREQVLANAPAREAGCVLVPRVMEE